MNPLNNSFSSSSSYSDPMDVEKENAPQNNVSSPQKESKKRKALENAEEADKQKRARIEDQARVESVALPEFSFSDLPQEIRRKIFSYVSEDYTIRHWRTISKEAYKDLERSDFLKAIHSELVGTMIDHASSCVFESLSSHRQKDWKQVMTDIVELSFQNGFDFAATHLLDGLYKENKLSQEEYFPHIVRAVKTYQERKDQQAAEQELQKIQDPFFHEHLAEMICLQLLGGQVLIEKKIFAKLPYDSYLANVFATHLKSETARSNPISFEMIKERCSHIKNLSIVDSHKDSILSNIVQALISVERLYEAEYVLGEMYEKNSSNYIYACCTLVRYRIKEGNRDRLTNGLEELFKKIMLLDPNSDDLKNCVKWLVAFEEDLDKLRTATNKVSDPFKKCSLYLYIVEHRKTDPAVIDILRAAIPLMLKFKDISQATKILNGIRRLPLYPLVDLELNPIREHLTVLRDKKAETMKKPIYLFNRYGKLLPIQIASGDSDGVLKTHQLMTTFLSNHKINNVTRAREQNQDKAATYAESLASLKRWDEAWKEIKKIQDPLLQGKTILNICKYFIGTNPKK